MKSKKPNKAPEPTPTAGTSARSSLGCQLRAWLIFDVVQKNRKWHCRDLAFLIRKAIQNLPNGDARFSVTDYPLSVAFRRNFYGPDANEMLSSDYGLLCGDEQIEKEYFDEVREIERLMVEHDIPVPIAKAHEKRSKESRKWIESLTRRANALQLWEWYSIPWRHQRGSVFMVYPPEDIMGSPIIHRYTEHQFLQRLADALKRKEMEFDQIQRRYKLWQGFGVIVIVFFGFLAYVYGSSFFRP